MNPSLQFPAPEPTDPEDVAWTLQTAGTMWSRGDHHEAVRWLRRAAEAASDAGSDLRSVTLARAAADLTSALSLPPSVPPPPVAPAPQVPMAPASYPGSPTPITPSDDVDTQHELTIPDARAVEPPARRATAAASASPTPPPPPVRSSPSAGPPPSRSGPSAAPPPPSRSGPSAAPPPLRSSPSVAPGPGFRPRQALRVAVTPSGEDKARLSVQVLGDDEALPEGAHEALLTALDPGVHLLSKKR